jgi:UDP-2,4-diacetamido-2,4,6-trideoxy-beta-L-altropyranose hydrolase
MNVLFKANSSEKIGSGHFVRTLNLALALKAQGLQVNYVFNNLKDDHKLTLTQHNIDFMEVLNIEDGNLQKEFNFIGKFLIDKKIQNVDFFVVDDYSTNPQWDIVARNYCDKLIIIEDLHTYVRQGNCVIDMNFRPKEYITKLTNTYQNKKLLVGPKYALLDYRYADLHKKIPRQKSNLNLKIFINYGTLDNYSLTLRTIRIILSEFKYLRMNVVIQKENLDQLELKRLSLQYSGNLELFIAPEFLGGIMSECDISIGSGGISLWERFSLGLLSATVSTAENQKLTLIQLHKSGFTFFLGDAKKIRDIDISRSIRKLITDSTKSSAPREKLLCLVDGLGVQRVINEMRLGG